MTLAERMSAAFDIIVGKLDTSVKAAQDARSAQKKAEGDRDYAVAALSDANVHITDLGNQLAAAEASLAAIGDTTALAALVTKAEALAAQP